VTTGLSHAAIAEQHGTLHVAGYAGGYVYYRRSIDGGASAAAFISGSTSMQVAASDDEQPDIAVLPTGAVVIAIGVSGAVQVWATLTGGEQWQLASTVS
jgi:hypothetical protein